MSEPEATPATADETTTARDARRATNLATAERLALALANATRRTWVVIGTPDAPRFVEWQNIGDRPVLGVARPDMGYWQVLARLAAIGGAILLLKALPW
mgnify:CR=1 FL=1